MKHKFAIILLTIFGIFVLSNCSKVYMRTDHESPYIKVLEDLKIPQYDSLTTIVEYRLWEQGSFGLRYFYRFYLSKDSVWTGEKYTPYRFGRRFPSKCNNEKDKNKLLWTKNGKLLNKKWERKWNKLKELSLYNLSGVDNYSNAGNSGSHVVAVYGGTTYEIEIFDKGFYRKYSYKNPLSYIELNKGNIELNNLIQIIKITTKEFKTFVHWGVTK
jgi:hypothetical protein